MRKSLVAASAIVVLLLGAWFLRDDFRSSESNELRKETTTDGVSEASPTDGAVETIVPRRFQPKSEDGEPIATSLAPRGVTLRVLDLLSEGEQRVSAVTSANAEAYPCAIDPNLFVVRWETAPPADSEVTITLDERIGGLVFTQRLGSADENGVVEWRLPIMAVVDIAIETERDDYPAGSMSIESLPSPEQRRQLSGREATSIEAMSPRHSRRALYDPSVKYRPKVAGKVEAASTFVRVPISHEGDVVITPEIPEMISSSIIATVRRGAVTPAVVRLKGPPRIKARLVDENDVPIVGQSVEICGRSWFDRNEVVPLLGGGGGLVGVGSARDTTGLWQITSKHATTDARGEVEVCLSFSDEVAVVAFVEGRGKAFASADLDGRYASSEVIVAKLVPYATTRSRMRFFYSSGEPAASSAFEAYAIDPVNRFNIHPPLSKSDPEGWLDTSMLEVGTRYIFTRGSNKRVEAVVADGAEVRYP